MFQLSEKDQSIYRELLRQCLVIFEETPTTNVTLIADQLMKNKDVPMHYPFHHFIIPAAFLTATVVSEQGGRETLQGLLQETLDRAMEVPGGICGHWGICGAAAGAGIYFSVYTGDNPMADHLWSLGNQLTSECLSRIASVEGPRCCKRVCYMTIERTVPFVNEHLGLNLICESDVKCRFSQKNTSCRKESCPYYRETNPTPILVPNAVFPKKDPEHPCPCQDKEVNIKYKQCQLFWRAQVGDHVEEGQIIAEAEVEKKTIAFPAPISGTLVEKTIKENDFFGAGAILGYIE